MSLFAERRATSKKIIELQNKIFGLQNELQRSKGSASSEPCEECKELELKIIALEEALQTITASNEDLKDQLKTLKSELRKSRTEATRAQNKLAAMESKDV